MVTARIFTLFKASTRVAAFGRYHKGRGAAFGRATSFVVPVVVALALNMVNIVAVTAILVLHLGVIGQYVPRHQGFMCPFCLKA